MSAVAESVPIGHAREDHTDARRRGIVATLVAVLAAMIVLVPHVLAITGHRLIVIEGGSMAPTYLAGDVLVTNPPTGDDLHPGAIVTVGEAGLLYTHRVVDVNGAGHAQLKGDANTTADLFRVSQDDVFAIPAVRITGLWAAMVRAATSPVGAGALALFATAVVLRARAAPSRREGSDRSLAAPESVG